MNSIDSIDASRILTSAGCAWFPRALAQADASLHLIGQVLNHRSQATTAIYARLDNDATRDALEEHSRAIIAAVEANKPERL